MNENEKFLVEEIEEAKKGRKIWLDLRNKWELDENWFLIILPEKSKELNSIALLKLDNFLNKKYVQNALILYSSYLSDQDKFNYSNNIVFVYIEEKKLKQVLRYYRLKQFFKNIVVISLEEPFGNSGFIEHIDITLENYIEDGLYV